jgi:hypothetical protein
MNLNDLFRLKDIDPQHVLVLRHRPREPQLNKVLPWLAAEKPNLFNAYQQSQSEKVEQAMKRAQYIASFIGHEPGKALFVGLYSVKGSIPITREQFWEIPENIKLRSLGMNGFTEESPRSSCLWFDLMLTDFYHHWKGKLVIGWPGLELAWCRWAYKLKNEMSVLAILEECALDAAMPKWDEIEFSWEQLDLLPSRLKSKLEEWRGIYYIFDISDGKGYVGSAYGKDNIYGRWKGYAKSGHGGNSLLKKRDPHNFRFTILQRVSPDMNPNDVVGLEWSWMKRLHTRKPHGLNATKEVASFL